MPPRPPLPRPCGAAMALGLLAALLGCGSAPVSELPPPAGPRAAPLAVAPAGRLVAGGRLPAGPDDPGVEVALTDGRIARVDGRARTVSLMDARGRLLERAAAGVGPARGASRGRWLWVTDTQGDALLVFRVRPRLALVRRVYLPGGPYAIAVDARRYRLWVTLTGRNELVELPAHGRPRELGRLPTVRRADAVVVDPRTGRIFVRGRGGELQELDPPVG